MLLNGPGQGAHGANKCRDLAPVGNGLGGVAAVLKGVAITTRLEALIERDEATGRRHPSQLGSRI